MTRTITRQEIAELIESGAPLQLVETLRPQHFEQAHLPGAVLIEMETVAEQAQELLPDRDALVITYCSNVACQNSRVVAEKLAKLGYTNVRRYEAGKQDWIEAGLPVESAVAAA
jgi:rhodanese-related sulfurtransferase